MNKTFYVYHYTVSKTYFKKHKHCHYRYSVTPSALFMMYVISHLSHNTIYVVTFKLGSGVINAYCKAWLWFPANGTLSTLTAAAFLKAPHLWGKPASPVGVNVSWAWKWAGVPEQMLQCTGITCWLLKLLSSGYQICYSIVCMRMMLVICTLVITEVPAVSQI